MQDASSLLCDVTRAGLSNFHQILASPVGSCVGSSQGEEMAARPCMDDTLVALADSFESLQAAASMESAPAPQISLALSLRVPLIQE